MSGASAQTPDSAAERSVKAAYIYRFLPYIEWPAESARANGPIVIGVIAADEVAAELEHVVAGRQVHHRPLAVRRLGPADSLAGLHIVYIGRTALRSAVLARARNERGLVTITDVEGGLELGAIINLVQVDSKLRFEVATDNAERSGIRLSSRLLAVALRVRAE